MSTSPLIVKSVVQRTAPHSFFHRFRFLSVAIFVLIRVTSCRSMYFCRYLPFVPLTGRVWHKAILGGSGRRGVAQTRPAAPKMPRVRRHSSKKGRLKRQAINVAPLKRVRARGIAPGGSRTPVLAYPTLMSANCNPCHTALTNC